MNTIADYTEWKLRKQQAGVNAANIVLQSSQGSPDEIAGDLNLANEFGKVTGNPVPPLPMVQEYRSVFQQKIEEAKNKTILSNAPRLADWLRNPENAALSRDDLERLAWFERFGLYPKDAAGVSFGQGLANSLSYAGEQLTQMYNQFMMEQTRGRARDRELTFADILKEESQTDLVGPDGQRLETWDGSNFLRAAARWIDAQYAELIGTDDKAASEEYAKRLGETLNTMRAIPKSDIASQFETDAMKEGASFGEAVVNFATAFARNPMGGMAWAIETAGRSAPQLAAALATTVLTRNPMAGAGVAAGGSYLTERYVSPAEFFDEHGIDLSKPEDVQRLLNDPKLMEDAAKRGVIRGLVIGAFDALSMGVAGRALANNPLVEALAQGATQMVLGATGEYAARVAAGQEIDWNDVLAEGLAEIATTPIDLGIAGRRVQIMRRQAREAEEQRTVAEAMSNAAKVSALRNRMPERFRDFVASATEGGAVENVYVPAEQFVQYFQDLGADPWALVDDLDGVTRDDLDAALAAGGDLRIPTATYAAKIAGSDHDAWFLDNLKFDPEQMSTVEAAEFNARVQELMEEAWEEAEAIRREMEAHRTYEEEIYDTIVSRLRAAGQATDVSTTQAQLYARMYLAMADRAKMTVEEFMRRYPLPEIRGALPEGAKFKDVDELTRILAAARARRSPLTVKRGMSLLEFIAERGGIRDVGGDVRSILGGRTEIKRGRGKKTLKIVRDDSYDDTGSLFGGGPKVDEMGRAHGLDDVAQAAIEAGYLADHPDVVAWKAAIERGDQVPDIRNALLEAIEEELRGRPSYSINDQVDQRAIEEDEFYDQFDEYLDRLGVSLDDPDDVIREAIRKDEEARRADAGVTLEQSIRGGFDMSPGGGVKTVKVGDTTLMYGIARDGKSAEIFSVRTPASKRGKGSARFAIAAFLLETDALGMEVKLSASPLDKKTKLGPLVAFYKSFGFEPTGKTINIAGDPEMVRKPQRSYNQQGRINTDSEAFKRWFGDSKVVDDQGKPLVVYHGTGATINDEFAFDPSKIGSNFGFDRRGFFFTDDERLAQHYVSLSGDEIDELRSRITEAQASDMARALRMTEAGREILSRHVAPVYLSIQRPITKAIVTADPRYQSEPTTTAVDFFDTHRELINSIADEGDYDGVMISEGSGTLYVAFSPTQIKSVHNRGTWDPNDPRILYQRDIPADGASFDAAAVARSKPDGVISDDDGVTISKRGDSFIAEIDGVRVGELSLSWRGAYATSVEVNEAYRRRGIATKLYAAAERTIGRGMIPSPMGMSDDAVRFWKRKLSDMGPERKQAALQEALDIGIAAGIPKSARERVDVLGYREPKGSQYSQGARGAISYRFDGERLQRLIQLFEKADLSTFLHEAGHDFLIILRDLANLEVMQGYADRPIGEMYDVVRNWWLENAKDIVVEAKKARGVDVSEADVQAFISNGTTGDTIKDEAIDVGVNEYWARGFEAYLMEGKAPSEALRGAFEKFRAWLLSVYEKIIQIVGRDPSRVMGVNLNDDIRGVFDRMLATDEEIAKAQQKTGGISPVFTTAEQLGMTDEEYQRFLKLREKAEDEAKAKVLAEIMAPVKRQTERWYKEERAKVREQVEREVNSWRVYRAIEWMGNRRWLGDGQPEGLPDVRLSKDILVKRYGEGVLKTLPRGQQTVYTVDGGVDPDDIAGWFGFSSGDEMIQAMESAPRRVEAIEAETDKRMRELHGDPLNDGSIEVMALDAVHTEKRGEWIAAELKAVNEVAGLDLALTYKQAREMARQTVARMRVRDAMASNRYLAAERKAADEAERLAKMLGRNSVWMNAARRRIQSKAKAALREEASPDAVARQIDQANRSTENYNEIAERFVQAKRRQLINHALYMESRRVAEEVEKAENFVRKLNKASHRKKIAGAGRREDAQVDYLAAIDEILERYDFRRMSARQEASLVEFVEAMKAAGRENELAIPDRVLRDSQRRPYKTLTVEELRGVVDSLKNLEHIALHWNKLIDEKRQRDLDEVVAAFVEAYDKNIRGKAPGRVPTDDEQRRNAGRKFLNLVLNADTLLREIDGFKDFGSAYEAIKMPIDEAMNRLVERREKATKELERIYGIYSKDERREMSVRRYVPYLGGSFSKWELISIALNTGNEGNFHRLTDPRVPGHFTEEQVRMVLDNLDERDADFVQAVWDFLESFRDDIAKRERRVTGVEPKWVEPRPVQIAGKMLRGGYYPLKYDPRLTDLSRQDEAEDLAKSLQVGRFVKAQTRNGHLKDRAASSGRAVMLDMFVLNQHVNQVIYDLELSEPVSNAWRILRDERVISAFRNKGRMADYDALEAWLLDVGTGELRSSDFLQRIARLAKSNFTSAKLSLNLSTVMVQVAGIPQSMVVVGKRNFVRGVQEMFRPGVIDDIVSKSAFMRNRQTTFNKDIWDFYNDPTIKPYASRWGDFKREILGPLSFWLMTKTQFHLVDVPTWLGAYHQGLQKFGNDEAKAIAHADRMVARAQASGLFSDRSAVERGSTSRTNRQNDIVRLFTALGSYHFAKFNVAYERALKAGRVFREEGLSQRSIVEALSLALDAAFLFTLEAVLYAAIKGRLPGEDDDDDESWVWWLVKETGLSVLGTFPFVRDIASSGQGFEGGGAYGAITKELSAPFIQAAQGEVDKAMVKSIVNAAGISTGIPSAQINRMIDAAWRDVEGEDVSPAEYLIGKIGKSK